LLLHVAKDDEQATLFGSGRALVRRSALRPEIRAALALEDAGELQEAARIFEYAGEHAQAAVLRLEHARTVRDAGERLDVLREGCARNPGATPEGRALHRALAESLLTLAAAQEDPARRRSLELEAARALEEADDGAAAGELYEELGLLDRAARAYEKSGEIARLEVVLEVLERFEQEEAAIVELERDADVAIAQGQRRSAWLLLRDHVAQRERFGRGPRPALVRRLRALDEQRPRPDRVDLIWNDGRVTRVRSGRSFRIGRAPDADLVLSGARLSRMHVELTIDASSSAGPRLSAVDLGSRLGTFWNGEPLEPGEAMPLLSPGELALGVATAVEVHPLHAGAGALVRAGGDTEAWHLYLPAGGPLVLAPEIRVPARVLFDRGWVVLDLASTVEARLGGVPLPAGAEIDLLLRDRIELVGAPLRIEVLG
jgi:tetratricopeptide (TPR) repeat protein